MNIRSKIFIAGIAGVSALATACGSSANISSNNSSATSNAKPANTLANTAANSNATANTNTTASTAKPFSKTVELHGIKFLIESPNTAIGNTVTIKPSGLTGSNEEVKRDVKGEVTEAEVDDLNLDQSPEVYVYVTKSGPEKGTDLIAYATNSKKSMTEISLSPPDLSSPDYKGFKGENEFAVVENSIIQRFPIYDGDKKTGKTRQIQYKLKPGEATWQLAKEKTVEY